MRHLKALDMTHFTESHLPGIRHWAVSMGDMCQMTQHQIVRQGQFLQLHPRNAQLARMRHRTKVSQSAVENRKPMC